MGTGPDILGAPVFFGSGRSINRWILAMAIPLVMAQACLPNPKTTFDASCGNDLECMSWYASDLCNDGLEVNFSFYAPGQGGEEWGPYRTETPGEYVNGVIKCRAGQTICVGASSGERSWGLKPGGEGACADCCGACNGMAYKFYFPCGAADGDIKG